jgi:micrococcal nuclease
LICILYILIIFYIKEGNDIKQNTLYKVNYIYDGDTISILYKGRQKTIRLLGIDTPETVDPRKPVQCFGEQASLKTKELLNNRSISLVFNLNREQKDKYNRYLGYVYRDDGLDINRYLIEHGYAREYTYGKPYERQKEFRKLEKQAKERSIGLWNTDNCPQMQ